VGGAPQPERLSAPVRALLLYPDTELTVSVVSAQIALKPELGIHDVARWFREAACHSTRASCRSASSTSSGWRSCRPARIES
jgi:hypothetical protein